MFSDVFFSNNDDVLRYPHTEKPTVNGLCGSTAVDTVGHHHQNIQITMGTSTASGSRSKENDPHRVDGINNAAHQFSQYFLIWFCAILFAIEGFTCCYSDFSLVEGLLPYRSQK